MGKIGKNALDIQESNRASILRILVKEGVLTRVELSRMTGLKQATITNIINEFLASGIVYETGTLKGNMGRRTIGISINADKFNVVGIKIARRSYSVGVFNIKNQILDKVFKKQDGDLNAALMLRDIVADTKMLIEKYGNCSAIGVAVPGPYLRREGRIAVMSEFVGWETIDIREQLSRSFEQPVFIEHDANAGALGEWSYLPENQSSDVLVHLLASEGIGTGVVINGKIISGYRGIFGEVGHMSINAMGARCVCGNYGCLEMYCSALALVKDVTAELAKYPESSLNSEEKITAEVIFQHMKQGDAFCVSMVKRAGRYLGIGIANIVNIYDPKEIVISDIMSGGGEVMMHSIQQTVRERLLPDVFKDLIIRYSNVPEDLILYGAASVAIDMMLEKPDFFYDRPPGTSGSNAKSAAPPIPQRH